MAFAAGFAACVLISGAASAADIFLKDTPEEFYTPAPIWSGLYAGLHAGGAWGDTDVTDTYTYIWDPTDKNSVSLSGPIAGVHVGYNVQRDSLVFGIEASIGYMDLSGDKSAKLGESDDHLSKKHYKNNLDATYSLSGGLYGDLTARIGYAAENALFYIKGGGAFLNSDFNANYVGGNCTTFNRNHCGAGGKYPSTFDFSHSETLWGWTIGAGVEYALSSALSLRLDYQHFDFGSMSYSYSGEYAFHPDNKNWKSKLSGDTDISTTVDVVTVGFNYKLDQADAPLK